MDKLKNYLLWPILAIALALSIYLVFVCVIYHVLTNFSAKQEEKLWQFIELPYQQIDQQAQQKIQTLVDKLPPRFLPSQYKHLNMIVYSSDDVNAFAAPGGRIIVTTGLLETNLSEDAILFVIGHEIAHLKRKDYLYEFAKMIAAKTYGTLTGFDLVTEILLLVDNSKLKATEFLADQYSAELLKHYNNSLKGAEEFFRYLLNNNSYEQSSTHPSAKERLNKITSILSN